jgi:hypothetical protein
MAENRVFTDEELREMEHRTLDILLEAIDAGDKEKAKKLADRLYKEFQSMHDLYMNWSAALESHIYNNYGVDELQKAVKWAVGSGMQQFKEEYGKADFRRQVKMLAAGLRGHLQALEIQEDDEKVCIKMVPCGSGQRLFQGGGYEAPRNFAMMKEPHPLTYGQADFPIYCCHAPLQELIWMEWYGYPVFVTYPVQKMGRDSCWYCIYKDPDKIPEETYRRLGKKKPAARKSG